MSPDHQVVVPLVCTISKDSEGHRAILIGRTGDANHAGSPLIRSSVPIPNRKDRTISMSTRAPTGGQASEWMKASCGRISRAMPSLFGHLSWIVFRVSRFSCSSRGTGLQLRHARKSLITRGREPIRWRLEFTLHFSVFARKWKISCGNCGGGLSGARLGWFSGGGI